MRDLDYSDARVLTPREADNHISEMWAGESFVYYVGWLSLDRDPIGRTGGGLIRTREVARLADHMLQRACGGIGTLTQRRLADGIYEYRFTKCAMRRAKRDFR